MKSPRSLLVMWSVLSASILLLASCGRQAARAQAELSPTAAKEGSLAAGGAASGAAPSEAAEAPGSPTAGITSGAAPALPTANELPAARMVIKTATLSVRVKDVASAFSRATQLAETRGGFVLSSTQETSGGDRADLTIRVPPEGFLGLLASLESLGTVEHKSIAGEDVTEEYYDLDAQLGNLTQVRGRLLELLQRAAKVSDAVEVERELERVGGELNRIEGRMRYLRTMVGLSTIDLSLYSEERPAAEPFINWSLIANGFVVAARVLLQALFFILQALVVVIPIGAIAGAVAYGIWRLVRLLRARSPKPTPRP